MHKDGFEKHVAILSGCQVLYLKDSQIDKLTYNGSQLHRDMVISLANNNPNIKYYVIGTCLAARTKNDAIETTNKHITEICDLAKHSNKAVFGMIQDLSYK